MEEYEITPVYKPVVVCFAGNDNYALPMCTAIYSMLENRDRTRCYDILILYTDLLEEHKKRLLHLADSRKQVTIRLVDVARWKDKMPQNPGFYYSVEAIYRLLLLGKMFVNYDRILYLDCDIVVNADISSLYDTEFEDKEIAAVRDVGMRAMSKSRQAIFYDDYPYNVDNYRTDALKIQHMEDYFNSGVILFNLKKARQRIIMEEVFSLLSSHKYTYCDQDVLNILFDGRIRLLDCTWNYMTCIEEHLQGGNVRNQRLYQDLQRNDPKIIHYIGGIKPWKSERILGEYYWKYYHKMEEEDEKKNISI